MKLRTLREQVLEEIRKYITQEGLKPGDALPTEQHFADRLGVSRTVVREAMKGLESLGVVEARTRRGYRLREVDLNVLASLLWFTIEADPSVVVEVVEAHRLVQTAALPQVPKRATDEDWERLEAAVQEMKQEVERGGIPVDQDEAFHVALVAAAHNRVLTRLEEAVGRFLRDARTRLLADPKEAEKLAREHDRILKAVRKGDVEQAQRILERHIEEYVRRGAVPKT
jgi:GntR family transcriptional repressor for pyruvate dehydrogenase complex